MKKLDYYAFRSLKFLGAFLAGMCVAMWIQYGYSIYYIAGVIISICLNLLPWLASKLGIDPCIEERE